MNFQSHALEKLSQIEKTAMPVWTGIVKRNKWIKSNCDMNYYPDKCKVLSANGTEGKMDCEQSHVAICLAGKLTFGWVFFFGGGCLFLYFFLHNLILI